ncbi:MAG: TOBE domain-containing protein, partial [Pseudomonadota bacterium]
DEPLSNLDAELRVQMRVEISQLHEKIGITTIYVTHDQVEAMTLADKIVVLRDGIIEQVGKPLDIFDDPENLFVASFIGSPKINILDARVASVHGRSAVLRLPGEVDLTWTAERVPPDAGSIVKVGLRPQHLVQTSEPGGLKVEVDHIEHLGGVSYVYGHLVDGSKLTLESRLDRRSSRRDELWVQPSPEHILVFAENGQRVR